VKHHPRRFGVSKYGLHFIVKSENTFTFQ